MTGEMHILLVNRDCFPGIRLDRDKKRGNWIPACAGRTGKKEIGNEK